MAYPYQSVAGTFLDLYPDQQSMTTGHTDSFTNLPPTLQKILSAIREEWYPVRIDFTKIFLLTRHILEPIINIPPRNSHLEVQSFPPGENPIFEFNGKIFRIIQVTSSGTDRKVSLIIEREKKYWTLVAAFEFLDSLYERVNYTASQKPFSARMLSTAQKLIASSYGKPATIISNDAGYVWPPSDTNP